MPQPLTPETHVQLPVNLGEDDLARRAAAGPEQWANLLIAQALEASPGGQESLLKKLHLGNVAVGVVFAPDDWLPARRNSSHPSYAINYGRVAANGDVLTVSAGLFGGSSSQEDAVVMFHRPAAQQPYHPVSVRQNGDLHHFAKPPAATMSPKVFDALQGFGHSAQVTNDKLHAFDAQRRHVPYVRISS